MDKRKAAVISEENLDSPLHFHPAAVAINFEDSAVLPLMIFLEVNAESPSTGILKFIPNFFFFKLRCPDRHASL